MKKTSKFIYFLLLILPMGTFAQSKEDTSAWLNAYASDLLGYFNNGANEFSVTKEGLITKKTGSVNADGVILLSENTSFNAKDLIISDVKCTPDGSNYMFTLQTNGNKIKTYNGTLVPKIEIFSLIRHHQMRTCNESYFYICKKDARRKNTIIFLAFYKN